MPCGMGPALSFLKNTKWKEYRDVAMIPFVCLLVPSNTQELPDVLEYVPLGEG